MLITERDVETCLKNRVEGLGGMCIKLPAAYANGIPDRLVILPGGIIAFIEVKRPKGGRLAKLQEYIIQKLKDLGCNACVVKNFKDVDKVLKELTDGKKITTNGSL